MPGALDILSVWCGNEFNVDGDPIAQQTFFDRCTAEIVSVGSDASGSPDSHALLHRVHPNPSRGTTSIEFVLPAQGRVTLRVLDVSGRVVRELLDAELVAGTHHLDWDGHDDHGEVAPSGIYWQRLEVGEASETRRFVLVR